MANYAAEPPPLNIDPELAEYLMRQMLGIQNAINYGAVLEVPSLPTRPIPGGMVNLNDRTSPANNGFYICVYDSSGVGAWKKLAVV